MQQACHSTTGISGWKSCNVSHVPINNQHTCSIPRNCSVSPALASGGPPQHATPAHHRQQVCVRVQAMKGFGFGSGQKADKQCPCGSGQEYSSCCQRYHKSTVMKAPTAEAVLRARFSAYVKRDWKFIVQTTHPENASRRGSVSADGKIRTSFEEDIKVSMYNCDFKALRVLGVAAGDSANEAVIDMEVDFIQRMDEKAKKLEKGIPQTLRERGLFVHNADGEWQFLRAVDSNWSREELKVVS